MEAGPAEPGLWHAWRRACLVLQFCSPQGGKKGGEALLSMAGADYPKLVTILATPSSSENRMCFYLEAKEGASWR